MKRSIFFSLALFSMAMFLTVGLSAAAPEKDPEKAPPLKEKEKPKSAPDKMPDKAKLFPPLSKEVPESIEDLRAIEMQVQKVLDKVLPCTVCVLIGAGSGSGVIVTEDGIVLTAGHVSKEPGTMGFVVTQDGKRLRAKSLGRNGGIDSGMMKILDRGPVPVRRDGQIVQNEGGTVVHRRGPSRRPQAQSRHGGARGPDTRQQQFVHPHRLLPGRRRFGRAALQHARRGHRHP